MKQFQIYGLLLAMIIKGSLPVLAFQQADSLTREQRVMGLTKVYCEAKYNFPYWDQIPDLDWDQAFMDFMPLVEKAQTNFEYFRLLEKLIVQLHDGHTFLIYGKAFENFSAPPVTVMEISGKPVITEFSPPELMGGISIEKFSEILSVDGVPVQDYLIDSVYPCICAGTEHYRKYAGCIQLLRGKKDTQVELEIEEPDGTRRQVILKRNLTDIPLEKQPLVLMELPTFPWKLKTVEYQDLGDGIHHIKINTMANRELPELFGRLMDSLNQIQGLVIDLRLNHGGNSRYADQVSARLISSPIARDKRMTPSYRPSERTYRKETFASHWYEYEQGSILPEGSNQYTGPIVVLTSPYTWSAAENFLVPLVASKRITVVGQPTGGSTGQPLFIPLVGGASIGICSVKSMFPDGKEFVGYGIQPDVFVEPDLKALREGKDNMLLKGIEILRSQILK